MGFSILKVISLIFLAGCAQVTSLNLKKHEFGKIPTKIIWIQIAGLQTEHLAMLKYSYPNRNHSTAFENSLCVGNTWEYNLYNIRPNSYSSFLGQLTGKKNIKNSCSDYSHKSIWQYIAPKGYEVGIFESSVKKRDSLLQSKKCREGKGYLDQSVFWSMSPPKSTDGIELFHTDENRKFKKGHVYFDRSCLGKSCYTTLSRNIESTFESFSKNVNNYLYIIRDFNFLYSLEKKNILKAKEELTQLNETLKYFQRLASKRNDVLVLVTSAASRSVEFPRSGRQWKSYETKGRNLISKKSQLVSSLFASGARAENFCGIFEQDQILPRIFSGAKQQGLEFSIINPFKQ